MLENGALGFITYDGNANYADRDIDQRELRSFVHKGNKHPNFGVNQNVETNSCIACKAPERIFHCNGIFYKFRECQAIFEWFFATSKV